MTDQATAPGSRPTDRRERRILELLAAGAVVAVVVGIRMLAGTDLASSWGGAWAGVAGQLPVTGPAAILVAASAVLQLTAGSVIVRALRGTPYGSVLDALLGGLVGAVVIGLVALMVLGSLGLFRPLVLVVVHAAVIGLGWWVRPILARPVAWRPGWPTARSALVALAWSGAVVLQIASPVVPFIDVLPNHVAPAEHLRAFGAFEVLTTAPSPIYGPSRMFLGYSGLLGSATVLSGQPAALAVAAFILPAAVLVGAGLVRLASAIHGAGVGWWMLLTFTLTESFARLTDNRATVLVLPVVAFCLVELLDGGERRRPVVLAVGLAGALYLHPLVGVLAAATIGAGVALAPERFARLGVPGLVGGGLLAVPQATTMLGIDLPSAVGLLAIPPALAATWLLDRSETARRGILLLIRGTFAVVLVALAAVVVLDAQLLGNGLSAMLAILLRYPILLTAVAIGVLVAGRRTFAPMPVVAVAMGLLAVVAAAVIPWSAVGIQGLDFEVAKTVHYWTPVFGATMAAFAMRAVWVDPRLRRVVRAGAVGIFLLAAALPIRAEPIDALFLGEHRLSETLSINLRAAEHGFWTGYPDPRTVMTASQAALVDRLRDEVTAGRLGATTPVLHVAVSFQQWEATPIGVFGGMLETVASEQTEDSIHTAGGRLHPLGDLGTLLAAGYPYVVLEPRGLPSDTRDRIVAAGYRSIFVNERGEIFTQLATEAVGRRMLARY